MAIPKVAIVDDEPVARDRIARLVHRHLPGAQLCVAGSAVEAVSLIRATRPDLVFLDVQMPGSSGFDVIQAVGPDAMPAVIFVTAYDEYATQAFEVNAVDYLLKPFTETRLADALRRWLIGNAAGSASLRALLETITRENATYLERISVRVRHGYTVVNVADIDYLESENNYIRLFTGEQSYLVRGTLSAIEQQLDPSKFARIHRSVIVNLTQVTMLKPWFSGDYVVVLKGGRELRLTRTFTAVLQRGFGLSTKHQLRA